MKKTLLLITFVLSASFSAFGDACTSETLDDYLALPSTGCTVGDITFTDFGYAASGTVPVLDSSILVTPELTASGPELQFNNFWGVAPGESVDSFISFTATCDGCLIDDLELTAAGASATTPGSIANATETVSPFLVGTPLAVGSAGGTTVLTDTAASFTPVSSITVGKDIGAYGGAIGAGGIGAQISDVTNLFSTTPSTVPEPSLAILCAGLAGLLPVARRKFIR